LVVVAVAVLTRVQGAVLVRMEVTVDVDVPPGSVTVDVEA